MEERIPLTPPTIKPIKDNLPRPRWSVMIPTYNCIRYLKATIECVLAQGIDPEEMQIEVIDDHSTDGDIGALVAQVGLGRVGFFRQPENRGSLRNFETCINRARGQFVHILHGDDLIKPGFYKEIERLFNQHPEAGAAFTDHIYIDENNNELYAEKPIMAESGIPDNWLSQIAMGQRIQPPAIVVKRSVYEDLGSFFAVHYGEDWEMWTRIASKYPMAHSPTHLARYRIHTNNITSRSFLSGQNVRDIKKVIGIIRDYLPADKKQQLSRQASKNFSIYFAHVSHKIYHDYRDPRAALKHAGQALHMHLNKTTILAFAKLCVKYCIKYRQKEMNKVQGDHVIAVSTT
ncbi:MAG: glycosyltransferase [Sphingobacteriales bacterium]|nr:MAG: glycosyltransferase [Sphingobacteriales bacterium]